jgi:hypothetical protein
MMSIVPSFSLPLGQGEEQLSNSKDKKYLEIEIFILECA